MEENKNIEATENITPESIPQNGQPLTETPQAPAVPPHKEYAARMAKFRDYYIRLLWCVGAAAAIGIVLAVIYNVIVGVCVAVLAAIVYKTFTYDEMLKQVGVGYKSIAGGIKITACRARYGEVIWVPQSLIWFDITEIGDRAFESDKNAELKKVFLPQSLKKIGSDIFSGCENVREIYFEGDARAWEEIEKETDFSACKIIFEAKYPPIPKKKKKKAPAQSK